MESSRGNRLSLNRTRRAFLKQTALGVCSSFLTGTFTDLMDDGGPYASTDSSLSLHPEAEPGLFSIRFGNSVLLDHAFVKVETESGVLTTTSGRYTVAKTTDTLLFRDTEKECDIVLRWNVEEEGRRLVFDVRVVNRGSTPLRVKNIYPLLTSSMNGKGLTFWNEVDSRPVLNDEWERCYGAARFRNLNDQETVQSAWDLHLFDVSRRLTCSLSYHAIPNTKLSFALTPRRENRSADLTVRADTHAGARGVLVPVGETFVMNALMVRLASGSPWEALESYARMIAVRNDIPPPPVIPVGWVDWYFTKAKTTEKDVLDNLDFIARELKEFGMEYVQIDSGWQLGVETTPPPHNVIAGGPWTENRKFPRGMKWYADEIRKRGLKPGIWVRPFHVIDGAKERIDHPSWFNEKGQMDVSNQEVRTYVEQLFKKLTEEWGYEYVKYDFPSFDLFGDWGPKLFGDHAAHREPADQTKTSIESYRESLRIIAETVRGKAHLLACNSVMPSTLGLAEVFRIGDDVGDWARTFTYGVKSVSARYYTNGVFWTNDPDCLLVREPFTLEQAQMWGSLIALSGGVVFVSEYLSKLPAERLAIIKKLIPVYRNAGRPYGFGRPIDLFEHDPPRVWSLDVGREFGSWTVVGLFNWDDHSIEQSVVFDELGVDKNQKYHVFDFWKSQYRGIVTGSFNTNLPPQSCAIVSLHPVSTRPIILSTTRHITQGGIDLIDVGWDEEARTLRGRSLVVRDNSYEVIIHQAGMNVKQVTGSAQRLSEDGNILRIALSTDRTGGVEWGVTFR